MLYADGTGSPVDSVIRDAAALAYDDPAQLTDLVMWTACPPGEHGLRGGKWDHVGGPWRGECS